MVQLLATVGTYASPLDAELERSRLEAAGVDAFVHSLGDAFQLRVGLADLAQAREILDAQPAPRDAGGSPAPAPELRGAGDETCLICRSSTVGAKQPPLPVRLALSLVVELLPLPIGWLFRPRFRCDVCGHEWSPGQATGPLEPR